MRRKETWWDRFVRDTVGMSLEVGLIVLMMAVAFVIAIVATHGRF
jgi:hypothetical protein